MKRFLKKFFKILGIIVGVVLLAAILFIGYLTITEYNPAATETIEVQRADAAPAAFSGDTVTVLSWNVGYGALGEESDFFMDGGTQSRPESEDVVKKNMAGIADTVSQINADFCFLQEIDSGSKRSYFQDEVAAMTALPLYKASAYAYNYKCPYVPVPWPPLGKVQSGLLTLSRCDIQEATRISLPCPFSWPLRIANLKRCLLVSRVPIEGSDKELVLVNLHLEAYDDGEGKIAQTKQLLDFLNAEVQKGNYVIAGGDWNQLFPGAEEVYPNTHTDLWTPGVLNPADFTGFSLLADTGTPTCRLLNQPYDPADTVNTQYYVIDGFVVSGNFQVVSTQTLDEGFAYSDHNPVLIELRFAE